MIRTTEQKSKRQTEHRRGFLAPMLMIALSVVMVGIAVVLDQLWLDNAAVEMDAAVEASSLAAAQQLVNDDLLRPDAITRQLDRLENAREQAIRIAAQNRIAGQPLDFSERDQIRFGRYSVDPETGENRLTTLDSSAAFHEDGPNTVIVTAERTRENGNPVALWFRQLTGQHGGDVVRSAEATVNNSITGFRATETVPIPALPIAILRDDATGSDSNTWESQIEQRLGEDNYSYDSVTGAVTYQSDNLPEIVLRSLPIKKSDTENGDSENNDTEKDDAKNNVQLINLRTDFDFKKLQHQLKTGWTADALSDWNGAIHLPAANEPNLSFSVSGKIIEREPELLRQLIGQCRIFPLYERLRDLDDNGFAIAECRRFVAARIMAVRVLPNGVCEIVLQPGVLITKTAIVSNSSATAKEREEAVNRYIYKLQITR